MKATDFILQESANEFRVLFTNRTFPRYEDAIAYANANLETLKKAGRAALEVM